ncbi:ABC transporter ATP-binding protein [Mesorhizobium atlanticum]|uniref:Peptide ABC transporter ATP-binding protein n=1 Tax=Mesorhizobium atlanticum TaxID=2233532 RepID=A0A330GJF6_9HYPH|nr:ABC transporter ATP-binding protein [Mesorhizobium atlanticum]RAZ72908.1 peptide ABC transporter ATP-binding protein [Mesorhizobium atlanticum]
MTVPLLKAERLVRRYGVRHGFFGRKSTVHAVDDVSLTIRRGETLALVGESGCGKSTTGRLLIGLEPADAGAISFDGTVLPMPHEPGWRSSRARMQMVFQDPLAALDRHLTIREQIREPLDIHRFGSPSERAERVAALLSAVGLGTDHATRYPHELSGGQRQRAVLARALAPRPDLIVCDEPMSALDVSIQAQIINLLADLQAELGTAMLFISHDLRAVRQVSHRVAVMYLGRIVEEGPPDEVFGAPLHPYTQALVSAIPHPRRRRTERILLPGDPPNPMNRPKGCAFHPRCPIAGSACKLQLPALEPVKESRSVACHAVHGTTGGPAIRRLA